MLMLLALLVFGTLALLWLLLVVFGSVAALFALLFMEGLYLSAILDIECERIGACSAPIVPLRRGLFGSSLSRAGSSTPCGSVFTSSGDTWPGFESFESAGDPVFDSFGDPVFDSLGDSLFESAAGGGISWFTSSRTGSGLTFVFGAPLVIVGYRVGSALTSGIRAPVMVGYSGTKE